MDITMCDNKNCTLRKECYRFTAPVNEFKQSYFIETPKQVEGNCSEFWSNKGYTTNDKTLETINKLIKKKLNG